MHLHATVSIWQLEHDGTYVAELNGYKLKLTWKPEAPGERRGFRWEAERDGKEAQPPDELFEEAEVAMAHAEQFARGKAAS
ncbi:hypothetical protein [Polyangium sorediatum]|uniref:Uncharacterized protein n=1 Tax=Polyangium sorediatum TaxID=889274 RepID=A0ABT6P3X8_9BACT|nr:hypothetical protein [Polyangium sorediatum]MDI1435249.1 hypothetical protein [Polyangium sorediatum]